MAKHELATGEVEDLFYEVLDNTTINNWVEFKVLINNKQKEVCKLWKTTELVQALADDLNIAVIVNEDIFNQLPIEMKRMVYDEMLAGVQISDSDAVSIDKPDFNTYTGVLAKYGDNEIIKMHESIKSLYDAMKQKEDEEKAQKKAKQKNKSS